MAKQKLLTKDIVTKLVRNGRQSNAMSLANGGETPDHVPVVKLFYPAGAATWLITEMDPDDPNRLFGLCDLGQGTPEIGPLSLAELLAFRGRFGLGIERDAWWTGEHPLSVYAELARDAGRIIDRPTPEQVARVTGAAAPGPGR